MALPHNTPPPKSAFNRPSDNLESIFDSAHFGYFVDANIVVNATLEVPVHRYALSARNLFFKNVFSVKDRGSSLAATRFELKEFVKEYDFGLDALLTVLGYLYIGKLRSLPKGVCVCVDDACAHVARRPVVDFMVEILYASATFQISELVSLYQSNDDGKSSSNDRFCIEILEQAERRVPSLGEALLSLAMADDDLRMKLLYLENRVFPRCSEVLNKIMDGDDISQLQYTRNDTPELRLTKRRKYMKLQEVLTQAFDKDKEEFDRSGISSSSSSTSIGVVRSNGGKITIKK
ncbi:hypothetical protein C1H46_009651 [Malus baccata]|uniref:Uncharacterized protein n=1 Tax=Malus baccata TaxID=106549 RepID=A0A540N163_MALBA|nr:hypothetical protein C1H46_009651 [Malus baccata]